MRPRVMLVLAALAGGAVSGVAAQSLRAGMLGSPSVGKAAPALELPYVTAEGPGPADQPFRLGAELGRVVILVFGGGNDSTSVTGWRQAEAAVAPLLGRSVVAAGVVRGSVAEVADFAATVGGSFKLAADAGGRGARAWGIGDAARYWTAFVVGDDGRLVWSGRIDPARSGDWDLVGAAVRRGRTVP